MSDRQIATHVGVDEGTVGAWREKLTAEIPQSAKRTGRDGRTIKVTNIGKTASRLFPRLRQGCASRGANSRQLRGRPIAINRARRYNAG